MAEQGALRTEKLNCAGRQSREILHSAGECDQPSRNHGADESRDVRRERANAALDVGFEARATGGKFLDDPGEALDLALLGLPHLRPDTFAKVHRQVLPPTVGRDEIEVRAFVNRPGELRKVEAVPFPRSFEKRVLLLKEVVDGGDGLTQMILRPNRRA